MTRTDPSAVQHAGACPCCSNKNYEQCCKPLHLGAPASSAEALMRSRYSAFCLDLPEYIERSWHSSTRPKMDAKKTDPVRQRWIGLRVQRHESVDDDHALVEFIARYKINGRVAALHEVSRFVRENGHWLYVDGVFPRS